MSETTIATALTCTHCLQTFEDDKQLCIHREYDICSGHDGHECGWGHGRCAR